MPNYSSIETKEQREKKILSLTMMDDLFFNTMLSEHPDEVEEIIKPIIGREVHIHSARTQAVFSNLFGRGVRFDIEAEEVIGDKIVAAYDVEVENFEKDANPTRARYNHAALDTKAVQAGTDWNQFPETYVIMIFKGDYFGKGLPLYHIENRVEETGDLFNDRQHIIYVNGS